MFVRAWKVWGQEHFKRIKHSLGFRTWFGKQKLFGGQNFVWESKKCLGFKTWSGDFGFEICAWSPSLFCQEHHTVWLRAPWPGKSGTKNISTESKNSLGFKTRFGIQKKFGVQNFVWKLKKCLGFKTWSGDFVLDICALELIALSSETSFPQGLNNFL